jgi:hypothetical protein
MLHERQFEGPLKHAGAKRASIDGVHTPDDVLRLLVGAGHHAIALKYVHKFGASERFPPQQLVSSCLEAEGKWTVQTCGLLLKYVKVFGLETLYPIKELLDRVERCGVTVHDVTVSPTGNCIGGFRIGGLDSALSCKEDDTSCSKWTTGAALGGFVSLADADKIDIVDIGKTLCTVLTSKTGADNKSCPKTAAGALDVQGDSGTRTRNLRGRPPSRYAMLDGCPCYFLSAGDLKPARKARR